MKSTLLIGRFGPISISLNYTWLFISVLGLWGLAFLWLPDNFPQWSPTTYWVVSILVMGLYLVSLILRELARAAIARFNRRGIILYPFGAATPYRLDEIGTSRALVSMFGAVAFSLALGGLLLLAANPLESATGLGELARSVLIPLGWLNLWVGILNVIPGIPFDGGRILTIILLWFSGEKERGLNLTRVVGEVTSLGLVLAGAWIGLTSQNWITSLVLVVLGWGAREADEKGKQLNMLRMGLSELSASDIMEKVGPKDNVSADSSLAKMVYSHPYYASDRPIAVMKNGGAAEGNGKETGDGGEMIGVITLAKAENLLQGTWPTTPVLSLMEPTTEVESVASDTPLTDVVEMIEDRPVPPDEQSAVPVIDRGRLVGSIDPSRLAPFEQAELELGAVEASPDELPSFFATIRGLIPALVVLAVLAIVGNIAISSDPYSFRNVTRAEADAPITFTDTLPAPGTLMAPDAGGIFTFRSAAISAQPVTTASLTLDGKFLPVTLTGPDPAKPTVNALTKQVADGLHTLTLLVVDRLGRVGRSEWQFWVGAIGTPTPAPGPETLQVIQRRPIEGALVLAGSETSLGLVVSWAQTVQEAHLSVDGQELKINLEKLPKAPNQYYISAVSPGFAVGNHTVHVYLTGSAKGTPPSVYATDWSFFATKPDDQNIYFKETRTFVAKDFYDYWTQHGGLDIFGFPISDPVRETDPASGEVYTAQYFERARFERHPALGNMILLGSLGTVVHTPEPPAGPLGTPGSAYFTETGHNLSGQFLEFWNARGGLAVFGYPISEERIEASPQDGKEYHVQYFERAKFELHPELAGTPYVVQLAQLGKLVYESK